MTRLAIAVAGVVAGFAALPQAAAALPCELESYETPLTLEAPDRVAFGRAGVARVTVARLSDLEARVDDPTLSFEDAAGNVVSSHHLTDAQLKAAAAQNPWDREPIEISLPGQNVEGQSVARLTYAYRRPGADEPCEVVQEQRVRWFRGVPPRFTIYGGESALLDSRRACHEFEMGIPRVTVRYRSRATDVDLCSGSKRYRVLPGLRVWTGTGLTGENEAVTLLPVGWRASSRLYRVDVSWQGATTFTRWLVAAVRRYPDRRVYRDRAPRAFRDICQGEPAGAPLPILRDSQGRRYCRTPGETSARVRVVKARPTRR
jgi:hypothetical protein